MRRARSKLRVAYRRERGGTIPYRPPDDLRALATSSVPDDKADRSLYLSVAMKFAEEKIHAAKTLRTEDAALFGASARTLKGYAMQRRDSLSKRHRMLLWVVRARARFIAHWYDPHRDPSVGTTAALADLLDAGLVAFDKPMLAYTQSELWRALLVLVAGLNDLRSPAPLADYVDWLTMCCGKFFLFAARDGAAFDHPLFRRETTDGNRCANEDFFRETERLVYGVERRLHVAFSFPRRAPARPTSEGAMRAFRRWLDPCLGGARLDFVEGEFRSQMFEWRVLVGEKERYVEEEAFGEASGYNVVAKWRPECVDECTEYLDRPEAAKTTLDRVLLAPSPSRVDPVCDGLCAIAVSYMFDAVLTTGRRFRDAFVKRRDELRPPALPCGPFPLIVQSFNGFDVWHAGELRVCDSFAHAFVEWVRLACEDERVRGLLPDEPRTVNLLAAYEMLFPEEVGTATALRRELDPLSVVGRYPAALPAHYGDDTDAF